MDDLLFYNENHTDLSDVLRTSIQKMKAEIGDTAASRINGATNEELVQHFVAKYHIEPLVIYADRAVAEHNETKVDVSRDRTRSFMRDGGSPIMVQANQVTIRVPFTGEPTLFQFTPSTRTYNPPRGRVHKTGELGGTITLTLALPADTADAERFNRWIKDQLDSIQQFSSWVCEDLARYNQDLNLHACNAITDRRQQLENQGALLGKLSIPVRPRGDAPSPIPIPMPKKVVKPLPPARMVEQEYGISDADYEYILKILRQESRSFESTPSTFAKLTEEELRDVVLAHLNGHFEGSATGERFRKNGKTDICIEHGNRAAFVAECKLWGGPKALGEAIDQLLGYLTWRDTRTSLIMWNKNVKDFAKLQRELSGHLKAHSKFVRDIATGQAGEWRGVFQSDTDEGREIVVHCFLVDLSTK